MTKLKQLLAHLLLRKPVQLPENEKLFVEIKCKNGHIMLADRLLAEYFQSKAPFPSQRSLDRLFEKVTRLRILDVESMTLNEVMINGKAIDPVMLDISVAVALASLIDPEVLLDISDTDVLASLRECMIIVEDESTFGHCMCLGNQALELYAGQQLLATITLHHGTSIRWDAWKGDDNLKMVAACSCGSQIVV